LIEGAIVHVVVVMVLTTTIKVVIGVHESRSMMHEGPLMVHKTSAVMYGAKAMVIVKVMCYAHATLMIVLVSIRCTYLHVLEPIFSPFHEEALWHGRVAVEPL